MRVDKETKIKNLMDSTHFLEPNTKSVHCLVESKTNNLTIHNEFIINKREVTKN